ncbi:nucleotide sugar dehydrogenase [Amycolatopsis taiwanensis]|uniref:UDP-N-acetyl-D-glucosamine dehydrogenase n=1 Tax=Amycolatopsis taiwanensis TaxID=342230 RepID=A0A9W6R526_9PSEU|nr:nucleotide sugar dehydrogenase [Amycolatopsis taiwanensis]GLY69254.1 UDP-N-acetyl-D-glucosamine dehydrogenase [Amycolatopsis taiwanensis]
MSRDRQLTEHTRLVVVGQGHVGLPVAMRAVSAGYCVVGLDVDAVRVWSLKAGRSYVDGIGDVDVCQALATGRYRPTVCYDEIETFDAAIITVPVPVRNSAPDFGFLESAVEGIAPQLRAGATVVLESACYPGTTEEIVVPLLEKGSGLAAGTDFSVGYSPSRARPGNPKWTFENTPKLVSGVDDQSLVTVRALYDILVDKTVPVETVREAELAKLLEDTFEHVNLALANEMAMFAHQLDVDVWKAIDAATTKPFGFLAFQPGPGVGGHCLPVGPGCPPWRAPRLAERDFRLAGLANDLNEHMPDYLVERLAAALEARQKDLSGSVITLLGLAAEANTGDIGESPALRVSALLAERGAVLRAVDSHVEPHRCPAAVKLVELSESCLRQADAVVLLTDHDDIDYELVERESQLAFDTRHRLRGSQVEYL